MEEWNIVENTPDLLPEDLAAGFREATCHLVGAYYEPLLYIANQIVEGTNHMIICKQVFLSEDLEEHIVKLILHQTLPCKVCGVSVFSIKSVENII